MKPRSCYGLCSWHQSTPLGVLGVIAWHGTVLSRLQLIARNVMGTWGLLMRGGMNIEKDKLSVREAYCGDFNTAVCYTHPQQLIPDASQMAR